jgi:hypothetical protein
MSEILGEAESTAADEVAGGGMALTAEQITEAVSGAVALLKGDIPQSVAYELRRILRALRPLLTLVDEKFSDLAETYAERDEHGNPVVSDDGEGFKLPPESRKEYREKLRALQRERHPVDCEPIKKSTLAVDAMKCPKCRHEIKHAPRLNGLALANLGDLLDETA